MLKCRKKGGVGLREALGTVALLAEKKTKVNNDFSKREVTENVRYDCDMENGARRNQKVTEFRSRRNCRRRR